MVMGREAFEVHHPIGRVGTSCTRSRRLHRTALGVFVVSNNEYRFPFERPIESVEAVF